LVLVEVYTPSGSWSSYPPHKHDVHRVGTDGTVLEADLEEVYFYKHDKPDGFAYQQVYTDANHRCTPPGTPSMRWWWHAPITSYSSPRATIRSRVPPAIPRTT
jgi:hypothetical protein